RFLVSIRSQVPLHYRLVGPIFVDRVKDAVNGHHPKSEIGKIPFIWGKTYFSLLIRGANNFERPHLRQGQKKGNTHHSTGNQQDTLNDVQPNNSLKTTHHGI